MEWWHAIVLGVVEGITEYLPVSSTGHLILASELMGLKTDELRSAINSFEIVIQGGAILAVVGLYWPRMVQMLRGVLGKDRAGLRLFMNLVIAFIPSAALGLALKPTIEEHFFNARSVMVALAVGGVYMIVLEYWYEKRHGMHRPSEAPTIAVKKGIDDVRPTEALLIGVMQCASLIPGVSRSMMTITGGYVVGLPPRQAAEFSFLLGLPTLVAATLYSLYKNLDEAKETGGPNLFDQLGVTNCLIGMVVAAASATLAVKWLVGFLGRHGLTPFGYYRLALCAILAVLVWQSVVTIGG